MLDHFPCRKDGAAAELAMMGSFNRGSGQLFSSLRLDHFLPIDHRIREILAVRHLSNFF